MVAVWVIKEAIESEDDYLSNKEWEIFADITYILNSVFNIDLLCEKFLQQTGKLVGYEKAAIFLFTSSRDRPVLCAEVRCDHSFTERYLEDFLHLDYLSFLYYQTTSAVFRESDYFTNSKKKDLPFYRDFLKKNDIEYRCCFNIVVASEALAVATFYRSRLFDDFSEKDLRILGILQKHLTAAFEKTLRYEMVKSTRFIKDFLYENVSDGIIILDSHYEISYINRHADKIIQALKHDNAAASLALHGHLQSICKEIRADYEAKHQTEDDTTRHEEWAGFDFSYRLVEAHPIGVGNEPEYVVIVNKRENARIPDEKIEVDVESAHGVGEFFDILHDVYGLTKRELELANLIIDGFDNHEIAERLFISLSTVKSHLQNVFYKLSIKTRNQLTTLCIKFYQEPDFRIKFSTLKKEEIDKTRRGIGE